METGSSSLGASGPSGSSESLHGLKFGKKIYFERGGTGACPSSAAPPAESGKRGKAAAQPPRCQVEGCKVDLTGSKAYYCRHKVCGMHSKAPRVVVAGLEQRFCQQCSRFHQLSEFDQGKRSCRRRLAGHNERRRKPPPGSLLSRYGHLSSSFHEERGRLRSFLMDFTYPQPPSTDQRDAWLTARATDHCTADRNPFPGGSSVPHFTDSATTHGPHNYIQGAPHHGDVFYTADLPPNECLAGVLDSSCALSLLSTTTTTQPWTGNNSTMSRASTIATSSSFDGTPRAAQIQSLAASNYASASSWEYRGHDGSTTGSHQMQGAARLGQFSGELELALQGNGPHMDHGSTRSFDHSGHGMNWSL